MRRLKVLLLTALGFATTLLLLLAELRALPGLMAWLSPLGDGARAVVAVAATALPLAWLIRGYPALLHWLAGRAADAAERRG